MQKAKPCIPEWARWSGTIFPAAAQQVNSRSRRSVRPPTADLGGRKCRGRSELQNARAHNRVGADVGASTRSVFDNTYVPCWMSSGLHYCDAVTAGFDYPKRA